MAARKSVMLAVRVRMRPPHRIIPEDRTGVAVYCRERDGTWSGRWVALSQEWLAAFEGAPPLAVVQSVWPGAEPDERVTYEVRR